METTGDPSTSTWQSFNFHDDEGTAQGMENLRLLLSKLQEAQANPRLRPSVNNLLMTEDLVLQSRHSLPTSAIPTPLEHNNDAPVEYGPMLEAHTTKEPPHTKTADKDFVPEDDAKDSPPTRGRNKKRQKERHTKKRRRYSSSSSSSSRSGRSSHGRFPRKGRKSPSPPSSPSSYSADASSSTEVSSSHEARHSRRKHKAWKRAKKLRNFKEGGKSVTFQTFDGSYGDVDKVLTFIQQFDAAFGGEAFTESSKLRHVAMHLTKSARHWWSTLRAHNEAPRTWKACRITIMKQFLDEAAEDNVLTTWRSLKLQDNDTIQTYINKFWDACLKASVYKSLGFKEKKQQFCAGLPDDIRTYVQAQQPKTLAAVIHHTRVGHKIFKAKSFTKGDKVDKRDKGDKDNGSSKVPGNGKKQVSKKVYQGSNRLSPEELERYKKENRCYRCSTIGHSYRECPQRKAQHETPKVSNVSIPQEKDIPDANQLCYVWEKIRDQHALMLMDPGSTHNIISKELAEKLGIKAGELGPIQEGSGAFEGQEVSVTPLIGKLRESTSKAMWNLRSFMLHHSPHMMLFWEHHGFIGSQLE